MQFDFFEESPNKIFSSKNYPDFKENLVSSNCQKCPELSENRTNIVVDRGNPNSKIVAIGEAPGENEDLQGEAFVGRAGQLLDKIMESVQLDTNKDMLIINVVKCRPPGNRDPREEELKACAVYLEKQIETINPLIIITLGRFSMARYFENARISNIHGKAVWRNNRLIVPMYHPAAALHQPKLRSVIIQDFSQLPGLIEQAKERSADSGENNNGKDEEDATQLRFF